MATYFVSATATNGFTVGNDGNQGVHKTSPFLTLFRAIEVAQNGDIIHLNDGAWQYSTHNKHLQKALIIQCENDYASTIGPNPSYLIYGISLSSGYTLELRRINAEVNIVSGGTIKLVGTKLRGQMRSVGFANIDAQDVTGSAKLDISGGGLKVRNMRGALGGNLQNTQIDIAESEISILEGYLNLLNNVRGSISRTKWSISDRQSGLYFDGGTTGEIEVCKNTFVGSANAGQVGGPGSLESTAIRIEGRKSKLLLAENEVAGCGRGIYVANSEKITTRRNLLAGNIYSDLTIKGECDVLSVNDTFLLRSRHGDRSPGYGGLMINDASVASGGKVRIVNPAFLAGDMTGPLVVASGTGYTIEHGGYPADRLMPAAPFIVAGETKNFAAWKARHDTNAVQEVASLPPYQDGRLWAGSAFLRTGIAVSGETEGADQDIWGNVWDVPPSIGAYQGAGVPVSSGGSSGLPGLFGDPTSVRHYSVLLPVGGRAVVPLGVAVPRNRAVVFAQGCNPVGNASISAFLLGSGETADTVSIGMLGGDNRIVHFAVAVF